MDTRRGVVITESDKLNNFAIEPKMYVEETPRAGFTDYAEKLNGRLAMLGFASLLAFEAVTGNGLIHFLQNL
ncbi:high light inducible protein [Phormidium sp. CCY1219]|uniref:high light inducible protein n=1 Tax=Phormidium sp. CCY1219 TaxID=2886104 RepID=UPI002D1E5FE7|nr:high light inducible protein [Phormidium sp. CCY1219]MEB3828441.1 high light inducible protein [Phormidium sp. CCY1219]